MEHSLIDTCLVTSLTTFTRLGSLTGTSPAFLGQQHQLSLLSPAPFLIYTFPHLGIKAFGSLAVCMCVCLPSLYSPIFIGVPGGCLISDTFVNEEVRLLPVMPVSKGCLAIKPSHYSHPSGKP